MQTGNHWVRDGGPWVRDGDHWCRMGVTGCGMGITGCRLRVTECGIRVTGCGMGLTGCRMRVAGCGMGITGWRMGIPGWRMGITGAGWGPCVPDRCWLRDGDLWVWDGDPCVPDRCWVPDGCPWLRDGPGAGRRCRSAGSQRHRVAGAAPHGNGMQDGREMPTGTGLGCTARTGCTALGEARDGLHGWAAGTAWSRGTSCQGELPAGATPCPVPPSTVCAPPWSSPHPRVPLAMVCTPHCAPPFAHHHRGSRGVTGRL